MKKIKKTVALFLITAYFFASCAVNGEQKEQEVLTFDEFPEITNLSHEKIKTEPVLYCVGGVLLLDSVLISVDLKNDPFFQVFKLPSFEHVGGFVTRGTGPEEEIFINPFICRGESKNEFVYKTYNSIKIAKYNEQTERIEVTKHIDLPPDLMEMWNVIKFGDSLIGNRMEGPAEQEFIGYNIETKEVFDFGENYPTEEVDVDSYQRDLLFGKVSIPKPDGSAFAVVYDKFPILRIYTRAGNLEKEVRLNNGQQFPRALIEDVPSVSDLNEVMQDYRAIRSSNNLIYALYIGKTSQDLAPGINDFSNEIHVWNWDGQPIKKILLDKTIFTFEVDPDDNYIIASSLLSLDALFKYKLK